MRAALGCQLAEAVAGAYGLRAAASEACVDVCADGFAFRLFLHSERRAPAPRLCRPHARCARRSRGCTPCAACWRARLLLACGTRVVDRNMP
jgi:hypothetical protein